MNVLSIALRKVKDILNENISCRIISIFPFQLKQKIVFDNFLGKGYGENPKFIAEEIIRQDLPYELVWLINDMKEYVPSQIKKVKYGSIRALYEMATAKVWVDNVRNTMRPKKKNNQIYLQTWHGVYGDKPVEKEAERFLSKKYILKSKRDGKEIDGIVSANGFESEIFRKYFWLNEKAEILEYGSPAYEDFYVGILDDNKQQELKIRNNLSGKYVVVYAPTFRDDYTMDAYDIDCERIWKAFYQTYGDCVLIIRLHPNVAHRKNSFKFNNHILDGSIYASFMDLAFMGDAVISDYSSTLYDFAIAGKPAYIYASDAKEYFANRGSIDKFDNDPFDKVHTNDELENLILNFNNNEYQERIQRFFAKYPLYGPVGASEKYVGWIINKINKLENK